MAPHFFRGTQLDQNVKFKDKDKQMINSWKWPDNFRNPIDLDGIQLDTLEPWIVKRCNQLMGNDDDIFQSYIMTHMQQA